jgi:oligopeptide transport system ATP-binding protein
VALVGESGSGKSTIGLAMMRLIEQTKQLEVEGEILFRGKNGESVNLMTRTEKEMQRIRGNDIAMIFQEPMSSLNPIFTIGTQIVEAIRSHQDKSRPDALARALEMLTLLGIPNPDKCLANYPHQISGGMRQRVMIAMALACNPALLIADEPTTALDVTIQAQIVEILKNLQERFGMSILFITHNLGLVAEIADRVLVLYAGQVVELAKVKTLFDQPLMPYTKALLHSIPHLGCSNRPGYRIEAIPGNVPSPAAFPPGCAFHPRCRHSVPSVCDAAEPVLEDCAADHRVRCFRWRDIGEGPAS